MAWADKRKVVLRHFTFMATYTLETGLEAILLGVCKHDKVNNINVKQTLCNATRSLTNFSEFPRLNINSVVTVSLLTSP